MIKTVMFMTLNNAAAYKPVKGDRMISIMGYNGDPADLNPSWPEEHILRMNFDDVTFEQIGAFKEVHAHTVIEWLDKLAEDREAERLIVHCIGGRSRSVAVAEFVALRYGLAFDPLGFQPNALVREVLAKVMEGMHTGG